MKKQKKDKKGNYTNNDSSDIKDEHISSSFNSRSKSRLDIYEIVGQFKHDLNRDTHQEDFME